MFQNAGRNQQQLNRGRAPADTAPSPKNEYRGCGQAVPSSSCHRRGSSVAHRPMRIPSQYTHAAVLWLIGGNEYLE